MLIFVLMVLAIFVSVVLDLYGYYIKSTRSDRGQAELIALGNWVIYIARTINMFCALALAYIFEAGLDIRLPEIFLAGFLLSLVGLTLFMRHRWPERWISMICGPVMFMPFRKLYGTLYWRPVSRGMPTQVFWSFLSAGLIYLALMLPFFVAQLLPAYRMTLVFTGQLMNFLSTVIMLSYIEPRMMQALDARTDSPSLDGYIAGRAYVVVLMVLLATAWCFL